MHRLALVGLNHTTSPLEVREKLVFDPGQGRALIESFRREFGQSEIVLLSTCNRVELYTTRPGDAAWSDGAWAEKLTATLAEHRKVPAEMFSAGLYHKTAGAVVEHLFSVAASLDSMVLGETQILGQVRTAYETSREMAAAGSVLHPLFQRAVAVGKQVLSQTPLGEGRLSVASVAVDYAKRIFDTFTDKTVLSIGAGKMSALVLANLAALRPKRLLVCNRDATKAAALAGRFSGEAVAWEGLAEHLAAADIVVSGTGSVEPIVCRGMFEGVMRRRRYKPVFLIDIALPRDVEAAVGEMDNVYLYNLDDLQKVVAETGSQRRDALDAAGKIVAEHVRQFAMAERTLGLPR